MFLDKVISFTLGAAFLLVLSCEGPAEEQSGTRTAAKAQTLQHEPAFWDYAASSNMLQVEVARVAAEKGATAHVRGMAQEAMSYHSQALKELKSLVQGYSSIQLPDSLPGADQGLVQEFQSLEGEELDARFREFILSTHNVQLDRYEEALVKADDQKIRDWIMDMRAHLQEEIDRIEQPAPAGEVAGGEI